MEAGCRYQVLKHQSKPIQAFLFEVTDFEAESDTVDIGNRLGFKYMRLPSGEVYAENRGEIWRVHIDQ